MNIMKLQLIKEGKAKLYIPYEKTYEAAVFYNPEAELNRDVSVSALQVFQKQSKLRLNVLDALAATGVRGLRYKKEVKGIKELILNDKNPLATKLIRKNSKLNKINCKIENKDANVIMHENVFNVIDVDPFGSPNVFLDSAARSIWHKGFLMITATDTAPLCGTYPLTCLKKYGIKSLKTPYYLELGMRILISYIILTLAKRDRAFYPVLSFADKHYFRVFGKIEHLGKIENLLKNFGYLLDCVCGNMELGKIKEKCFCGKDFRVVGPLYLGKINDKKFVKNVLEDLKKRKFKLKKQEEKLLKFIKEESDMPPFYFDLHYLGKMSKRNVEKIDVVMKNLRSKGFKTSRTHFCLTGIKTTAHLEKLQKVLDGF